MAKKKTKSSFNWERDKKYAEIVVYTLSALAIIGFVTLVYLMVKVVN